MQLGGAIGSWIGSVLPSTGRERRVLVILARPRRRMGTDGDRVVDEAGRLLGLVTGPGTREIAASDDPRRAIAADVMVSVGRRRGQPGSAGLLAHGT